MKKKIAVFAALIIVVFACAFVSACSLLEIQGKSAYEIACENGFTGTQEEWLKSLEGEKGADGSDGSDGRDGQNGQDANFDIYDLFNAYVELNPNATFDDFLQEFLTLEYYDSEYAAAKGAQSVVSVYCKFTRSNPLFGQSTEYSAAGSGVVYKLHGNYAYIITNYHVIYDRDSAQSNKIAHTIELYSFGYEIANKAVEAEFVGGSITKDIAVLKAKAADFSSDIAAVQTADFNSITFGQKVVAIGNPLAEGIAVTTGVVSVDSQNITMEALDSALESITIRVVRTDAAINSGNSGGGLFNVRGELLGIVNAKTVESGVDSMGYAIPISVAAGIADCVMENESKKCVLGITVTAATSLTQYNAAENKVEVIEAITVQSTSSSLVDGKLLEGDRLLSVRINNNDVLELTRIFHLSDYLYGVRLGDTLYLQVERNGQTVMVELTPTADNFTAI